MMEGGAGKVNSQWLTGFDQDARTPDMRDTSMPSFATHSGRRNRTQNLHAVHDARNVTVVPVDARLLCGHFETIIFPPA